MQFVKTENGLISNPHDQKLRLHYTEQSPCVLGVSTNPVEEILSRYPPTKLHHVTAHKHHYTNHSVSVASERRAFSIQNTGHWRDEDHRSCAGTLSVLALYNLVINSLQTGAPRSIALPPVTDGRRFETLPTVRRLNIACQQSRSANTMQCVAVNDSNQT